MRPFIALFFFVTAHLTSYGQCSTVSVQISSSDTTYIQLYHAGFFNIPSGFANVCVWEVTTFSGEVIYRDTTSGNASEQGFVLFNHSVPLTDSMKASIVITNNPEGIICTMKDTLYWEETEVIPGAFIGNWAVLSGNGGTEEEITTTNIVSDLEEIEILPSLVHNYFSITGSRDAYRITILDMSGQIMASYNNVLNQDKVDVSYFPSGMYLILFRDEFNRHIGIKKMMKM